MNLILLSLPLFSLAALPDNVVKCEDYVKEANPECDGQGSGCVSGAGWYSKDNTSGNSRVNAHAICESEGYTGASNTQYGGNYGHQCRFPGSGSSPNKAGGQLTDFGFTVTWQCVGDVNSTPNPTPLNSTPNPTPPPTSVPEVVERKDLPANVVDCEQYLRSTENNLDARECHGKGEGCKGEGWFSKDNSTGANTRVDAHQICKDQGFTSGADTNNYGGNWGDQCRYPGSGSPNKAGGTLTALGFTVTWKCIGTREAVDDSTNAPITNPSTMPTPSADWHDADWPKLPADIIDCGNYNTDHPLIDDEDDMECHGQGVGCVGDHWYSKESTPKVNAKQICIDQGYQGVTEEYGGNWGDICRYPGSQTGQPNKHGGSIDNFGSTVTWRCALPRLKQGQTMSPTTAVTPSPTEEPDVSDLPEHVVYCEDYDKSECTNSGAGCVTTDWFSKVNTDGAENEKRVDAKQVCIDNGYGDVGEYGGNYGKQCRYPGGERNSPNRAGGAITALGYTVSWQCVRGGIPTAAPTTAGDIMDCGLYEQQKGDERECMGQGDGCVTKHWYSHDVVNKRIDAVSFCRDRGYAGVEGKMYGGNWGHECRFPGTDGKPNNDGGALTQFGYTVTWKCEVAGSGIPTITPSVPPTMPPTDADQSVVVECGEYSEGASAECKNQGDGCVGEGWFSKDNSVAPQARVNAKEICELAGYDGVGRYGGNWGHLCRFPGSGGNPNKAGGDLTSFGFTVTFECVNDGVQPTGSPVEQPTDSPVESSNIPTLQPTENPQVQPTDSPFHPPSGQPTMMPSEMGVSTEAPTEFDCKSLDEQALCELFEDCVWNPKKKGKCESAPEDPKDICVDADRLSFDDYSDGCALEDNKKSCQKLGCKYSNKKGCIAAKKPKCKKVDKGNCCDIPGCNIQDWGKNSKKCYGTASWK